MQKALIVCATLSECKGLLKRIFIREENQNFFQDAFEEFKADLLITGVGVVATTFHLTNKILKEQFELIINIGIAGSFKTKFDPGTVLLINSDFFADIGAEDHDQFIDAFDLGLINPSEFPFFEKKLIPLKSDFNTSSIESADAITVNKVHGNAKSIKWITDNYNPDLESMEGAAVFYTANNFKIPSLQIRAVSNFVEPRNRENWKIEAALSNLSGKIIRLMKINGY